MVGGSGEGIRDEAEDENEDDWDERQSSSGNLAWNSSREEMTSRRAPLALTRTTSRKEFANEKPV